MEYTSNDSMLTASFNTRRSYCCNLTCTSRGRCLLSTSSNPTRETSSCQGTCTHTPTTLAHMHNCTYSHPPPPTHTHTHTPNPHTHPYSHAHTHTHTHTPKAGETQGPVPHHVSVPTRHPSRCSSRMCAAMHTSLHERVSTSASLEYTLGCMIVHSRDPSALSSMRRIPSCLQAVCLRSI